MEDRVRQCKILLLRIVNEEDKILENIFDSAFWRTDEKQPMDSTQIISRRINKNPHLDTVL